MMAGALFCPRNSQIPFWTCETITTSQIQLVRSTTIPLWIAPVHNWTLVTWISLVVTCAGSWSLRTWSLCRARVAGCAKSGGCVESAGGVEPADWLPDAGRLGVSCFTCGPTTSGSGCFWNCTAWPMSASRLVLPWIFRKQDRTDHTRHLGSTYLCQGSYGRTLLVREVTSFCPLFRNYLLVVYQIFYILLKKIYSLDLRLHLLVVPLLYCGGRAILYEKRKFVSLFTPPLLPCRLECLLEGLHKPFC